MNPARKLHAQAPLRRSIRRSGAAGVYGTVNYTYDDNGNRKTRVTGGVTQTYTSSTTSNRLSKVADGTTTRNFSYTGAGDLSSDDRGTSPDLTFSYNHRGRMSSLKTAGVTTATYKTDAWGERASKTLSSGPVTHYLYDTQGHLLEEADGATGAAIRDTIWLPDNVGPDLPIGQADASGTITYLHDDQLGQPQKITDATQAVVWDRTQQPFGEDAGTTGSTPTSLRFPGQTYDAEDALHYNLMRDYDPSIGRYIQYDPIGLEGGWNPYAYAKNNPVMLIDFFGLAVCVCPVVPTQPSTEACLGNTLENNIADAESHSIDTLDLGNDIKNALRFYYNVRNHGPQDYKQLDRQYEDFGNFNFGATGSAAGFAPNVLKRGAGVAQFGSGHTDPLNGSPFGGPPNGDYPNDQKQIQNGIDYYNCHCGVK